VRIGRRKESLLRQLNPQRMRIEPYSWGLNTSVCPCDVDFCSFLLDQSIRGKSIFHMGSGGHHLVGWKNLEENLSNTILAVTVSPQEVKRYLKMAVHQPAFAQDYRVLFADVHSLQAMGLPEFDVVSLFHLAAFKPTSEAACRQSISDVLNLFIRKISIGGLLLLYRGDHGYSEVAPLADAAVADGRLARVEPYRSLEVFRVRNH
jgi:hypothetical protein